MVERETKGGYPSGDVPASALGPFPEVLTRPAIQTAAPLPTAPKVPILACPKCGEPDTTMRWCSGGYSLAHGSCETSEDHFHRGCPRCTHRWKTFDVLDSDVRREP
jgi:hypothetical protein